MATITLELTPQLEQQLRDEAAKQGLAPNPFNNLAEQDGDKIHKRGQSASRKEFPSRPALRGSSPCREFNLLWQSSTSQ